MYFPRLDTGHKDQWGVYPLCNRWFVKAVPNLSPLARSGKYRPIYRALKSLKRGVQVMNFTTGVCKHFKYDDD